MTETKRVIVHIGLIGVVLLAAVAVLISRPDAKTRFIRAVQDGDVNAVRAMLSKNSSLAEVEQHHKAGSEPVLYIALRWDRRQIVRLLLSHGASPKYHPCPLRYAQDPGTVELLIQYGADVNGRDENNSTPTALHFFAASGNVELAEVIIDRGAELEAKNNNGLTPLHSAAQEGCLNTAKLLVSRGADINARSRENRTPFDYAVRPVWDEDWYRLERQGIHRCKAVAAYLLSRGSFYTVFDLAWLGDLKKVDGFIREDASLVNAQANGEPLLFSAIRGGNSDVVDYLLKHGAQLKVTGRFRQSPLQLAAYMGHADIARILLGHGAAIDEEGPWGETALHWAAVRGNTDVAAILLESRADVNPQTSSHTLDLNVLMSVNPDPVERELRRFEIHQKGETARKLGISLQVMGLPKVAFAEGDTPVHAAAYWNRADIVKLLIGNGADINKTNHWRDTPLHYAVVCRYYDITQMLFDNGADCRAKTREGLTAVELARKVKDKKLLDLLNRRKD